MSIEIEEARQRVLQVFPHIRYAIGQAKHDGVVKLGVLCEDERKGKRLECSFEAEQFFNDLSLLLDIPAQTEKDNIEAKAMRFKKKYGL